MSNPLTEANSLIRKGLSTLGEYGVATTLHKAFHFVRCGKSEDHRLVQATGRAKSEFVLNFDRASSWQEGALPEGALKIAWIIPDFGLGSGGHMTIFRIIAGLEKLGNLCSLYIMDRSRYSDPEVARQTIRENFLPLQAKLYFGGDQIEECDIAIATSWQTAYALYKVTNTKKKIYFVQDHESEFFATGAESHFAENTYKMGFKCITAGKWLSCLMKEQYKLGADFFELAYDSEIYSRKRLIYRRPYRIAVYVRPVTARRGFDLVVLAIEVLRRRMPQLEVVFFGWDCAGIEVPFAYYNYGILPHSELCRLYNEASVGMVCSLTNYSLLPQEMMACGLPVVDIKGPNTECIYSNGEVLLAEPNPYDIADRLEVLLSDGAKRSEQISKGYGFVRGLSWENATNRVAELLRTL